MQTSDPATVIRNAIENQATYLKFQKRRACRYNEIVRFNYGSGRSRSQKTHSDELYFDIGGENATKVNGGPLSESTSSSDFEIWDHPLFRAILKGSIFSREQDRISWDGRIINVYRFVPDPAFKPSTDVERYAQAVYGMVSIDQSSKIFVGLNGVAQKDIYEGKRLLVLGPRTDYPPIPVFYYSAAPYDGIIVPTIWDEAAFTPVRRGSNEVSSWLATLTRTFVQIQSCRDYKVDSTLLPGYKTLDNSEEPK
jgi:hypothetical protein